VSHLHFKIFSWITLALCICSSALCQSPAPVEPGIRLEDGTPIKLRLQETISSADAQVDQRVDFDVLEEVKLNDLLVIPKGSVAWGTITEAEPKRRMARGGKLNVNIDSVRLADGKKAALRGVKEVKGGGHTGAMTGGIVASAIVFFPAAPFFLFMHGKDVTIPKGTEVTVYINGNIAIDPAKFASATAPPAGGGTSPSATSGNTAPPTSTAPVPAASGAPLSEETIAVPVTSTPDGADIVVDQKFKGSTPSTLRLKAGDHTISIEKSGFKSWQRTITVTAGESPTISVTLEKE